jgi:3-oxoacyl-[acyl-carrier-protein] synthase-3
VLAKAGKTEADVDWLVPHQANIRIIDTLLERLSMDKSKAILTVDRHANTSAASIPLALDEGVRSEKIRPGHVVLMEAFGAGFSWGASLVRV